MFEPDVFRKKMHYNKENSCDIAGTFRHPRCHLATRSDSVAAIVIRHQGNCAPLPLELLVTPLRLPLLCKDPYFTYHDVHYGKRTFGTLQKFIT